MADTQDDDTDLKAVRQRVNRWLWIGTIPLIVVGPWMLLMGLFWLEVPRPQTLLEWILAIPAALFCGYPIAYAILLIAAMIERSDGKPRNTNWVATVLANYLYFLGFVFFGWIVYATVIGFLV